MTWPTSRLRSLTAGLAMATASCLLSMSSTHAQPAAKVEIGKPAPDFTATGRDGKKFKLSDKVGKDKNIVLLFSRASW